MPTKVPEIPRWAQRIKALRTKLGMSQVEFSTALNIGQSNLSKWERGTNRPTPDAWTRLARLAPGADKFFFLDEAGLPREFFMGGIEKTMPSEMVDAATSVVQSALHPNQKKTGPQQMAEIHAIPVLSNPAAAVHALNILGSDIEMTMPMAASLFAPKSHIIGLRVEDNSMSPILSEGDIALVDVNRRNLKHLDGCMVAVRIARSVSIQALRKYGKFYQLVPQNASRDYEIRILDQGGDWSVVGEVVNWIGGKHPMPPKRGK